MNKFKDMFHYGNFEKRIIITIIEYILSSIIWIVINQFMTYSLFDNAIARKYKISYVFNNINDYKNYYKYSRRDI